MMKDQLTTGMGKATRLLRKGRLDKATALIQQLLHNTSGQSAPLRGDRPASSTTTPTPWIDKLHASLKPLQQGVGGLVPPTSQPVQNQRDAWAGGQFVDNTYTNHAGTRAYKLYIPSAHQNQSLPLVVMLHGCTQTPEDFAAGTRMNILAEQYGLLVAYPTQAMPANSSRCWNWFKTFDQQREQGEPAIIAGITREIIRQYPVQNERVYIAGLSAGGAMAVIMAITYPELYAALGVHSGLAYAAAHDLPSAFSAMQQGTGATPPYRHKPDYANGRVVPTIVFHGDRDTTVHPCNGEEVLEHWLATHHNATDTRSEPKLRLTTAQGSVPQGRAYTQLCYCDHQGRTLLEQWLIHGAGHAWSGGSSQGSYTDPKGPDASREMLRFFLQTSLPG